MWLIVAFILKFILELRFPSDVFFLDLKNTIINKLMGREFKMSGTLDNFISKHCDKNPVGY